MRPELTDADLIRFQEHTGFTSLAEMEAFEETAEQEWRRRREDGCMVGLNDPISEHYGFDHPIERCFCHHCLAELVDASTAGGDR